jgi:hypothetical protein
VLVIRKNKKVLFEALDPNTYAPNYEVEKNKPTTLYVLSEEDRTKLKGGNLSGENLP